MALLRFARDLMSQTNDTIADGRWLREHAEEFAGQWVALRAGKLVDHDTNLCALSSRLDAHGDVTSVLAKL